MEAQTMSQPGEALIDPVIREAENLVRLMDEFENAVQALKDRSAASGGTAGGAPTAPAAAA
jgi:hypothetical protein